MAGYLIALTAFAVPFVSATRLGRPGRIVAIGGVLAGASFAAAAAAPSTFAGPRVLPLWMVAGLVALLYAIWCGGVLLGIRLRRLRPR